MADTRYASIQERIWLPRRISAIEKKSIYRMVQGGPDENGFELQRPLIERTNGLLDYINNTFQIFQNPEHFKFAFPESMFPEVPVGQRNQITYEQKIIREEEDTFKNKLSEEQLEEIAEKGEFKVNSNIDYIKLPYIWKINQTLFWGNDRRRTVWNQSFAYLYEFFCEVLQSFCTELPTEIVKILKLPGKLFDLIFGKKRLITSITAEYPRQVFKDFWMKIMSNNYKQNQEWGDALWKYLYVYYDPAVERPVEQRKNDKDFNERMINEKNAVVNRFNAQKTDCDQKKEKIMKVENEFNEEWVKLRKKVFSEINLEFANFNSSMDHRIESEQARLVSGENVGNNDDKILQALAEKKFTLYIAHLQAKLPKENIPVKVVNAIVFILRLFNVIRGKYYSKQKIEEERRRAIEEKIKSENPIRSLYYTFFVQRVDQEMAAIKKDLNDKMYESLKSDKEFTRFLKEDQLNAYNEYIKFRSNYSALIQAKKKQMPQLHEPSRIFTSSYKLLPPYDILRNDNGYYSLKKESDDFVTTTGSYFWKTKLYCIRLYTWTRNCLVFLLFFLWKSPVGLRCLCGIGDFQCDMSINYSTGEITYETRKTVFGTFKAVLEGISESRTSFENEPDLGLLGKNVSRLCNILECYVFRFFIVGLILVLICYPILIIICSVFTTVILFTVWLWVPLVLIITYIFNIFVFQFESSYIPDSCVLRLAPFIGLLIRFLISLFIILKVLLITFVWFPLKTVLLFIFYVIQRMFRRLFDCCLLCCFGKCGRTPSRDTSIARKISGPGMTKDFYMSINEQDVYILVQSQLEQIYLQKYNQLIRAKIESSCSRFKSSVRKILSSFDVSYYDKSTIISENMQSLLNNYQTQYNQFAARYPYKPSGVRFTQEELDSYFENTINIVRTFVERTRIKGWIFDKYQLYEDMYEDLTRSIWMSIFNCGEEIFEPLEQLDARFKLQDQYMQQDGFNSSMKKNVGSVMRALEGEVKLKQHNQKLAPFKKNLLSRELAIHQMEKVLQMWQANRLQRVNLDIDNVETLFVPNLNIKELMVIDAEKRERQIASNQNIVDL